MEKRPASRAYRQMVASAVHKRKKNQTSKKRVFSTCGEITQEQLQKLLNMAEERKIQELRYSPFWWERANGMLLSWVGRLNKIMYTFVEDTFFDQFILFVVMLNAATLVAQTVDMVTVRGGWFLTAIDATFIAIYLMEFVLKFIVWRFIYFKNSWNTADFLIIVISLTDFMMPLAHLGNYSSKASSVFQLLKMFKGIRVIRAFRVLRSVRHLQNLQSIVSTCLKSIQSMGAIIILMFTFLLMFAVIFREMFSQSDPGHFGTMFRTIFTLFQLLTLDDWSLTYSISRDHGAPHIIIFLILYIVVEYFTFLNLVMAVLVDNFQLTIKKRMLSKYQKFQDIFEDELESIRKIDAKPVTTETDEEFYQEALKLTYNEKKYCQREVELICSYLQRLAAIDQSQQTFWSQAAVLDRLIDNFFEAGEEDTELDST
ncbi:cation channel sperm-associated protein 1-like [Alosa alosa]|nr:cation channel sperm-associated protein 1-like [Alosa sapidissima]XP_041948955.1 cation channel sperm-associated protein 1-like [Alosa sapidissima]XP_048093705.1 cation channel sperm-associated protein 1-like [Alosa alosa]XP_048093706.1 cation channel sperm-associated protein 1-like [Alosa alosa]